ncbi:MAG: hypothetical protein IKF06_04340 [Lachnospiraceae bacterium]|nr:hypothetical protein [Lachnospiraceae bacterium]
MTKDRENYMKNLAYTAVRYLREAEDGEELSSRSVLIDCYGKIEGFSNDELMVFHKTLLEGAEKTGIELESLPVEAGMPWVCPFIVHNKKAKICCPKCGNKNYAQILYGMPAMNEQLQKDIEAKRVVIGGCLFSGFDPQYSCNDCGTRF